jgi:hypothetical protein
MKLLKKNSIIPFTISTNKINLLEDIKDLYNENYTSMKKL